MKLFVTTGFGNIIQGGTDIWVNHFIENVLPKDYMIFVDGKRPVGFNTELTNYHFHGDDSKRSEELLEECDEIHFLHVKIITRENIYGNIKINGVLYLYMHHIYLIC